MTILGFEIAAPAVGLGVLLGMNYALLAVGLVLVYRNSKLVNFAHAEIGAGAAVLMWVSHSVGVPYWVAFPTALALGGALAAALERSVIERLRDAPRAIAALATLGAGELILYISVTLLPATRGSVFPEPPGIEAIRIGTLIVHPAQVLALILGPLGIGGLVLLMTRTQWGLALRGAAADLDLARLSGFAAGRLSSFTWALSGVLASLAAILLFGVESDSPPPTGLDLLVPTLTAAGLARMTSLVVAAVAGFALGLLQHLLLWNGVGGGSLSVVMFGLIFLLIAAGRARAIDVDKRTRWLSLHPSRGFDLGKMNVPIVVIAAAGLGALSILLVTPTDATSLTRVFGFVLLSLSVAVVVGLSGQLILGQVAYAGFGAMASIAITLRTGNFLLGFTAAALAGAATALVSSLPALRRRDLSLAVLSLAFAFASATWAFPQTWMFGNGIEPGRPIIGSFALTSAKSYALFALTVMILGLSTGTLLWRSGLARRLVAQRDNPAAAATFGISAPVVRAQALLISGALAGVAGAVLGHATLSVGTNTFPVGEGIRAVGAAALGGITAVSGAIWGALFMVGLPAFAGGILSFLAASWVGWLLVVVSVPGGIVHAFSKAKRRHPGLDPPSDAREGMVPPQRPELPNALVRADGIQPEEDLFDAAGISVTIGDVPVIRDVTLHMKTTEIVGLVGNNGAGKSTLLDVITGQRTPQQGNVRFIGQAVTDLGPERRARLGMGRAFEGAILFPTMTVLDTTLMALENRPANDRPLRKTRRAEAMTVITWMGLERVADRRIGELSTGVRRMAQLACLCARRPRLLVLDEPASGVAQAELDGLMAIIEAVNEEVGTAFLIVEHELRVVHRLAARIAILERGRIVAEGSPDEVLTRAGSQG